MSPDQYEYTEIIDNKYGAGKYYVSPDIIKHKMVSYGNAKIRYDATDESRVFVVDIKVDENSFLIKELECMCYTVRGGGCGWLDTVDRKVTNKYRIPFERLLKVNLLSMPVSKDIIEKAIEPPKPPKEEREEEHVNYNDNAESLFEAFVNGTIDQEMFLLPALLVAVKNGCKKELTEIDVDNLYHGLDVYYNFDKYNWIIVTQLVMDELRNHSIQINKEFVLQTIDNIEKENYFHESFFYRNKAIGLKCYCDDVLRILDSDKD